jgi:hypothetical protein
VVGQKIAQLEARKRAAVEKEDYDTAKLIKVDIDKLRATGESAAGAVEALASRHKDPGEIFGRVMRASRNGPMTPASTAGVTMSTAAAEAGRWRRRRRRSLSPRRCKEAACAMSWRTQ